MSREVPEVVFVRAAHDAGEMPELGVPEVALMGRSNVGKSSFLNALAGGRPVARISRTPGRTRSVNFYRADGVAIVDLPGYGYARVSKEERDHWKIVIESYLKRSAVRLAVLLVDARTGATESDRTMHDWLRHRRLPALVAVTKTDKLGASAARKAVAGVTATLGAGTAEVLAVSARTRDGVREAWKAIVARLR